MKEIKNLLIVNSPLILLNALEAISYFKLKNILIVAIYNRSINNEKQIETILEKLNVEEIIRVHFGNSSKFTKYIELIKELQKNEYNNVFTGEIEDNFRIIISNIKKERLFFIDEGLDTVLDYENKFKKNLVNNYKLREIRYLFKGFKIKLRDSISFFTYYDFSPIGNGIVVENKLENLKSNFINNNENYNNVLFFFGQPKNIFNNEDDIYKVIGEVINKNKNKRIIYFPHREEGELSKTIKSIYNNVVIMDIKQPIEKYFIENGIYPKHVISYASTALITTKILYEECIVEYIKVCEPNIKLYSVEELNIKYKYFEKNNILPFNEIKYDNY